MSRMILRRRTVVGKPVAGVGALAEFPYNSLRTITQGTKYYVDPVSGNDADNGLSEANAFLTMSYAVTFAGPDTAILLMSGTHTWDGINTRTLCTSANDGTEANPCLITSLPGHFPIIDCNATASVHGGLCVERKYWQLKHLKFQNYERGVVFGHNNTCDGLYAGYIQGNTAIGGDNAGLLHVWSVVRTPSMIVEYVKATNTGSGLHANTGGIYILRTSDTALTVRNIECHGGPIGIHWKHGNATPVTQNATCDNFFLEGQTRWAMGPNPSGVLFTNGICGSGAFVDLAEANGGSAGDLNVFRHVTMYAGINLTATGATDNKFTDCIINGFDIDSPSTVDPASNYNLYPASTITYYGTGQTLAQWRTQNSSDAQSVEGTPTYTGTNYATTGAYLLTGGSPGKNVASDGNDIGATIATVGII